MLGLHSRAGPAQSRPVYVSVSLTDKNNLFIEDLSRDEIEIRENGQARRVEFMAREEVPTVYGIIVDRAMLGESYEDERSRGTLISSPVAARSIAYDLIDKFLGKQVLWAGCYDKTLEIALDFTANGFEAHQAIQQMQGRRSPEESFLYAALFSAVQRMNQRHEKRRILLAFLERIDSGTLNRLKPLKNLLAASNVELFVLSFGSRLGGPAAAVSSQMSESALRELAGATAGDLFVALAYGDHIEDLTRRAHNHMRTLYTFGFQADSSPDKPGQLVFKCNRPGAKVRVRATVPALP